MAAVQRRRSKRTTPSGRRKRRRWRNLRWEAETVEPVKTYYDPKVKRPR